MGRKSEFLITDKQAQAALERIQAGTSSLLGESKALGHNHNGNLRGALRRLLGKEAYNELMAGRRGRKPKTSATFEPSA